MESGPCRPGEKYKISKKQNMFPADDIGDGLSVLPGYSRN